jgi:hypothetical protein
VSDPLQQLRSRTAELVAQRLRSASAVIARLEPLIDQAAQLGHAHRSIHEAILAGGLEASWSTYRIARQRKRKARRLAPAPSQPHPITDPVGTSAAAASSVVVAPPGPLTERTSPEKSAPLASGSPEAGGTSSTTEVLAALQRARVAASKDYSRIAREEYRQRSRVAQSSTSNPSRKEPP